MAQARQVSGYMNAEGRGSVFQRNISLTPASVAAGAGSSQAFTVVDMLADDTLVGVSTVTADQTSGIVAVPGPVTAAGKIGVQFNFAAGTATATAATPLSGTYRLTIYRRLANA